MVKTIPIKVAKKQPKCTKEIWLVLVSFLLVLFSGLPMVAGAAKLYLEPADGEYHPGETFMVDVRIDTEGECINALEVNLSFSQDLLMAVDFSQAESILILWVKEPTFSVVSCGEANVSCGLVSFIGGIPGGYCGRIPGDPGLSNLLGKIIFKVPGLVITELKKDKAEVKFLDSSQVLLSDKLGTKAKLITQGAIYKILSEPVTIKDGWKELIAEDDIPPEPFEIEVHQNPLVFEGKYFIIFSTADKQTGIDYYEIKEGERDWKRGQSPYLLEDQTLESKISVKAVDKAGNERIVEYTPLKVTKKITKETLMIIITIIGLVIVGWIIKKYLLKWKKTR